MTIEELLTRALAVRPSADDDAKALAGFAAACRRADTDASERQRIHDIADLITAQTDGYQMALAALDRGDREAARPLLRTAAEHGIGEAAFLLAGLLSDGGAFSDALSWFRQAAEDGDSRADALLAQLSLSRRDARPEEDRAGVSRPGTRHPGQADSEVPEPAVARVHAVPVLAVAGSAGPPRSVAAGASVGPTVRRRRLGSELRRLREDRSIKLDEVAEQLGLAPSALSRIESGRAPTRSAYLNAMLDIYGVSDPAQKRMLFEMAREGHRKGWWAVWEDALPTGFGIYVGLEAEAASLRVYEAQVVHGLLQTEEYARAVMAAVRRWEAPAELDRLVRLRMRRQEVLTMADPLELWIILDEAVIRRAMGPPDLMQRQLTHLVKVSQWPNVTLQVLEFCGGPHPALNGSLTIIGFPQRFDQDVVYSEGIGGQAYLEERETEVKAQADAFDLLRATALPPADSVDLIRAAAGNTLDGTCPGPALLPDLP